MYFQFSSHLLLFAWRLPPPTGKKDFFRFGYDDDDDDDDDNGDDDEDDNWAFEGDSHTTRGGDMAGGD